MRRIIAKGDVDVCVIDVSLPGGENGIALAEEVAAKGCAVVLMTGDHSHFETVEKSGHRFLYKPFPVPTLLSVVQEALDETKAKCHVKGRRQDRAAVL